MQSYSDRYHGRESDPKEGARLVLLTVIVFFFLFILFLVAFVFIRRENADMGSEMVYYSIQQGGTNRIFLINETDRLQILHLAPGDTLIMDFEAPAEWIPSMYPNVSLSKNPRNVYGSKN